MSVRAMSCSSRTTCLTTTLEPDVEQIPRGRGALAIGVCFGGPSPEHDVSVLTGLQAIHELARTGQPVTGLYWSKTGDWYEIEPTIEASSFVEGSRGGLSHSGW